MNNKIIGFTISTKQIDHSNVDVFNVGLDIKHKIIAGLNLYYWGIGDINSCILNANTFTLSFPITESLLDRNVLIYTNENIITIENDWLGSIPIYYNHNEHIISTLCTKTIQEQKPIPNPEGINNYLEFGYSVFENTPVQQVKFLRFFSKITVTKNKITITKKPDPVITELQNKTQTTPEYAIEIIKQYINNTESKTSGLVVIPTSGGYDSRLLNSLTKDKTRIKSFTYGISTNQEQSTEVIRAKQISKILNTDWNQIQIGDYNKHYKDWYKLFGWSTHLHGMYHIEFYKKIVNKISSKNTLLSGIFGDVWAGNLVPPKTTTDIYQYGYTHGISVKSNISTFKSRQYKTTKRKELPDNESEKIISIIRNKLILISYLMSIPDYMGIPSWTPFLNMKTAFSMLNLPKNDREKRSWQKNYFQKVGLNLESQNILGNEENVTDIHSLQKSLIPSIEPQPLKKIISKKAIMIINIKYKILCFFSKNNFQSLRLLERLLRIKYIGRILKIIGLNHTVLPYNKIIVLKPLEMTFKKYE